MPTLEKKAIAENWFSSDYQFNKIYPPSIQLLALQHWTPLSVVRKAADFLAAENNAKILDIGSGVGKFCLAAAKYKPNAVFTGVEQRRGLVNYAQTAKEILELDNASFIRANFTKIDFKSYDHFYFFNSFYENLAGTAKIDSTLAYSRELYNYYHVYLFKLLDQMPVGTRFAAYHGVADDMPPGYHIVGSDIDKLLKFWIKV